MYDFLHTTNIPDGTSDPDPKPKQQYEVHCGHCGWWGMIEQMKDKPYCPMCKSDRYLEYLAKQEYLLTARCIKANRSEDFSAGFDAGAKWLQDYIILELLNCQESQQENLD